MGVSRIERADQAEEEAAAMSLRCARSKGDLVDIWMLDCDHFQGAARERLQVIYAEVLTRYAPMQRAG